MSKSIFNHAWDRIYGNRLNSSHIYNALQVQEASQMPRCCVPTVTYLVGAAAHSTAAETTKATAAAAAPGPAV
jgi:hypothetical protein